MTRIRRIRGEQCKFTKPDGSICRNGVSENGYCTIHNKKILLDQFRESKMNNEQESVEVVQELKPVKTTDKYAIAAQRRKAARQKMERTGAFHGQKLYSSQKPGFYRRWVNDSENRLDRAQDSGYTFVSEDCDAESTDLGTRVSRRVGTDKNGNPINAYLMEIPEEFRNEDLALKEQKIRKTEQSIRHGTYGDGVGKDGHHYYPNKHNNAFLEN